MEHLALEANRAAGVQAPTADLSSGESAGCEISSPMTTIDEALLVCPSAGHPAGDSRESRQTHGGH